MLMAMLKVWLVRFLHVIGAALWVGGLGFLALVWDELSSQGRQLALRSMRWLGALTLLAGLGLVHVTRGFASYGRGEWGGIVLIGTVLAGVMLGVVKVREVPRRWVVLAWVLGLVAVAFMTRAPYAR